LRTKAKKAENTEHSAHVEHDFEHEFAGTLRTRPVDSTLQPSYGVHHLFKPGNWPNDHPRHSFEVAAQIAEHSLNWSEHETARTSLVKTEVWAAKEQPRVVTGRIFSTPRKQALSGLNPECTTAIVTPRRNLVCTADLMTPAYILISVSQRL